MDNLSLDKENLIKLIKRSHRNKNVREFLLDNWTKLNDDLIDINVVKLIDDHPYKNFKDTMLSLLGHKKLKVNVLIYIASLGYYPEAFYGALIEKCKPGISHQELASFLECNVKYILVAWEFLGSIDYIKNISFEKKKEILDCVKENQIIIIE